MLIQNPFLDLPFVSLGFMQAYIIIMIIMVVAGTIFDVLHKGSARYFMQNMQRTKAAARRTVSGGEKAGIALKTIAHDVLASAEFCNSRRRVAHLLTMYGFIGFIAATVAMVLCRTTSSIWPLLWHGGALMVCGGGYWFWFFIRVDVTAEGYSPWRLVRADLFVVSLIATTTFALLWSLFQGVAGAAGFFFLLFMVSATVLFLGVPWSKFAHMFFKPAAAFEKRIAEADGSRNNLPPPADAPAKFGLGIKRDLPRHY